MEHGPTVKPDDRDGGAINAMLLEQAFDGLRLRLGHQPFGFGEDPGARPGGRPERRVGKRLPQQGALGSRIGANKDSGARMAERDAVGFEEGCLDRVEEGSAHQADGFERNHGCAR
jgi:hypothetical protein